MASAEDGEGDEAQSEEGWWGFCPADREGAAAVEPGMGVRGFLRDLIEHATQREFVYSHKWAVGDLVMWDNRQTMHRGRPFPAHEARDVRRTTLKGDGPTLARQQAA